MSIFVDVYPPGESYHKERKKERKKEKEHRHEHEARIRERPSWLVNQFKTEITQNLVKGGE